MNDRIIELADKNYIESWKIIVSAASASEIHEDYKDDTGVTIVCSGLPSVGFFNVAFVTRPVTNPGNAIDGALRFFRERGLPALICIRNGVDSRVDEAAQERGLKLSAPHPGMVLYPIPNITTTRHTCNCKDLEITKILSDSEIDDFAQVAEAAFGMPQGVPRQLTALSTLQHPCATFFLGRLNGTPVATSALIRTGNVAGIYWVTTDQSYRGRGIGTAMTWAALEAGVKEGCDMASLQASEMGRCVYERMGFKVVAPYNNYIVPALASETFAS